MDHRDCCSDLRWWKSIDQNRMVATVDRWDFDDEDCDTIDVPLKKSGDEKPWTILLADKYGGEMFDEEVGEILSIPIEFGVCPTCDGRGSYVNPSIDSHGISAEEFDEDPDFRESYMSGHYDVTCEHCQGARVVPVSKDEKFNEKLAARLKAASDSRAEYEAERRMGA